jgi:hypothetical protein
MACIRSFGRSEEELEIRDEDGDEDCREVEERWISGGYLVVVDKHGDESEECKGSSE